MKKHCWRWKRFKYQRSFRWLMRNLPSLRPSWNTQLSFFLHQESESTTIVNMTMISSIIIFKPMIDDDCHDWSWYDICHDCGLLSCSYLGHRVTDTLGQRLKDQLEPNTVHLPQIDNHFLAICTKSWFSGNIRKISYLTLPPQVSEGRRWCALYFCTSLQTKPERKLFPGFNVRDEIVFKAAEERDAAFRIVSLGGRTRWPGPGATRAHS